MADTIPNVPLPAGQWVDLYAASGIPVGVPISVENVGTADVRLTVRATAPPTNYDAYAIVRRWPSVPYRNNTGDSGAWAMCPVQDGKVNVRRAI